MELHEVEVNTKRKIQAEAETEVTVSKPSAPPGQVRKTAVATRSKESQIGDLEPTPNLNKEDESKRKRSKSRWDSPIKLKPIPESDDDEKGVELSETTNDSQVCSSSPPSKKAKIDESINVTALKNSPLGYFDYTLCGKLLTPITPAHEEFKLYSEVIALDCEMVDVGPTPKIYRKNALARISIVNEHGWCLYDKFVKPDRPVTDYRTEFSGIREADLTNATPFQIVKEEVVDLLSDHILVGHSLKHDFAVLNNYVHPEAKTWDTAEHFKKYPSSKPSKLRTLSKDFLGVEIQQGEHSSIIDAQAAMALYQYYQLHQKEWQQSGRP